MKWQEARRNRKYLRQLADVDMQFLVADTKRRRLTLLGRLTLQDAKRLSAHEEELSYRPSADSERYQHLADATTHSLGRLITGLARSWAAQG